MEVEEKLREVESELKLVKNEIKQGLTGVRDFLLSLDMPQNTDILEVQEVATMNLRGGFEIASKSIPPVLQEADRQAKIPEEPPSTPASEKPRNPAAGDVVSREPSVNTLANLVGWVSLVKQRLGAEHLPTIVEVYGMCGNMSPKVRRIILRLAELETGPVHVEGGADVWSQLMLQLHGILTGDISSAYGPSQMDEREPSGAEEGQQVSDSTEEDSSETPLRLKLVVPDGKGRDKELNLGEFKIQDQKKPVK